MLPFLMQKLELDVKLDWKGVIELDWFIKNYTKISLLESYNILEWKINYLKQHKIPTWIK